MQHPELQALRAKAVERKRVRTGKYGPETNAEDVEPQVDVHGKNVIVTGGYTGIGYETARVFAVRGARVFIVGRDATKGTKAVESLKTETKSNNIEFWECDLGSFASIRSFAEKFNALNVPLHYLINNAGVMNCPYGKTVDGLETQIGTNHFGHFLLTNLLVPSLIRGAPSRVVSVASSGHVFSKIRWDDMNWEKTPYNPVHAYGQSKTANILFAVEFNRRYKDQGVIANSLHPGSVRTELQRHSTQESIGEMLKEEALPLAFKYSCIPKTTQQGAATSVYAALSPDVAEGGLFCDDCQIAVDPPALPHAVDPEEAKKLWTISEEIVGLKK
eukprot:Phypoly_transcript_11251.p1 GENE.Phypoly_transcript_11251~~Phypoly_transcript_11251.p1  ORF type:complete len:331 (+),score=62.43 Phypoly_transcript_11251:183-1175(+)